jgi:hypothetical protein
VNAVMNLRISLNAEKVQSGYTTDVFSNSAQLRKVSLFSYIYIYKLLVLRLHFKCNVVSSQANDRKILSATVPL